MKSKLFLLIALTVLVSCGKGSKSDQVEGILPPAPRVLTESKCQAMLDTLKKKAPDYPLPEVIEASETFIQLWEPKGYAQVEEVRQLKEQMGEIVAALDTFWNVPIKTFLQARYSVDKQFESVDDELVKTLFVNEEARLVKSLSNHVLSGVFQTNDMVDYLKQYATGIIQADYLDKADYAGYTIRSISSSYASKSLIEGSDKMNCGATFLFALQKKSDPASEEKVKLRAEGVFGVDENGDASFTPTLHAYQE